MKIAIGVALSVIVTLSTVSVDSAFAQGVGLVPVDIEVPKIAGVGVGFLPDYEGSDDYTFGIAPFFRYTFQKQERYIQLLANELSVNLLIIGTLDWDRFSPISLAAITRLMIDRSNA